MPHILLSSAYRCPTCHTRYGAGEVTFYQVPSTLRIQHCTPCYRTAHAGYAANRAGSSAPRRQGCCVSEHLSFAFPANGQGVVLNDDRLEVRLPAGVISEEGMTAIMQKVRDTIHPQRTSMFEDTTPVPAVYWRVAMIVEAVGSEWQTSRGNFTRRLSSALYKSNVKLDEGVLSEIGNMAREHSSGDSSYLVEFTRDLNRSASYFGNPGSCWFSHGAFRESRCALKTNNGLAMRSFSSMDSARSDPNGRVWVQPLGEDMKPCHNSVTASAYLLYNGYGKLAGYGAAQIVAYLSSKSYKKVNLHISHQYINGNRGFLVADADTLREYEDVTILGRIHKESLTDLGSTW